MIDSLQIDEIILASICTLPFVLASLWFAVALFRGGKGGE